MTTQTIQTQRVKNQETPVPQTPNLNVRDYVTDMLANEKYIVHGLSTFLCEASHDDLFKDVLSVFNETQKVQRELYNVMFARGWYEIEVAPVQSLQQKQQQFQQIVQTQSPY